MIAALDSMGLAAVACPQLESELAVMQCALESRDVHSFVRLEDREWFVHDQPCDRRRLHGLTRR